MMADDNEAFEDEISNGDQGYILEEKTRVVNEQSSSFGVYMV